jgi:hypothetical protein
MLLILPGEIVVSFRPLMPREKEQHFLSPPFLLLLREKNRKEEGERHFDD